MKQAIVQVRHGVFAAVACATMLASSACGAWPAATGGGSDAITVTVQYNWTANAPRCTGRVTWVYTPLSLTGSQGRGDQAVDQRSYDVVSGPSNRCVFQSGQLGLKKGTWRIAGDIVGSCDLDLQGSTTVIFEQGRQGCAKIP